MKHMATDHALVEHTPSDVKVNWNEYQHISFRDICRAVDLVGERLGDGRQAYFVTMEFARRIVDNEINERIERNCCAENLVYSQLLEIYLTLHDPEKQDAANDIRLSVSEFMRFMCEHQFMNNTYKFEQVIRDIIKHYEGNCPVLKARATEDL